MTLLAVDRLSLAIGGTPILDEVSFTLEAGEILALAGESGSGKSMTALALMGLLPRGAVASGRLLFEGCDLAAESEPERRARRGRDLAMVFQEPMTALNPVHTIGDQVAEVLRVHGVEREAAYERTAEALARVGLPKERFPLERYPHELSGGQRQRVVIAMAIALAPKLIIADEPTTALDVMTQAGIVALLKELAREAGAGLLFISHDLALVAGLADRLAVMRAGKIIEEARLPAGLARLAHPYSRRLAEAAGYRPARRAPPKAPPPLLELCKVTREVGRRAYAVRAVDGVSLTIGAGESVGLVGPSGCGKSTLARTLLALEAPQGGAVYLCGADLNAARGGALRRLRRDLQAVFQDPYGSFNPRFNVMRLVAEPLFLESPKPDAPTRRARVEEMLTHVGLEASDADKFPHEFSGGQRQRIAIARALITKPKLVVLDEAVSALDMSVRAQVLDLIARLERAFSLATLFISHDIALVRAITDRVLVMKEGRIVEEGPSEAVFAHPSHPYTAELIAATPVLPEIEHDPAPDL